MPSSEAAASGAAPAAGRHVLGISALFHDSAAALVSEGEIVAAAQQERFSRRKNDPSFPHDAIRYCLYEAGIGLADLDAVVFHEKPWLHFERILETALAEAPRGFEVFRSAVPPWLSRKFFLRRLIRRELGWRGAVLFAPHHESHMGAAFYPSPFDRAAILTVDGVGEWATATWGSGDRSELHVGGELRFPSSLGLLYSAITAYLGFEVNEGEYKVMGLAPYGRPRFLELLLREIVDLREDGSLRLEPGQFAYTRRHEMTSRALHELLGGPPRRPGEPVEERHHDLASSLQALTEEALLRMARHVHAATGLRHLVLGGGVALNAVANGRLLREGPFDDVWVQPAAGDAGSALGCALVAWHRYFGASRPQAPGRDRMLGACLGPAYSRAHVRAALDRAGAVYRELADDALAEAVAERLDAGEVVGLFAGRMEFGPRALGSRSILADARRAEMKDVLNERIKWREPFRPFAPAVLESRVKEWFHHDRPAPYMVFVAPVRGVGIPAATHVDGSARLQTVSVEHRPALHRILTRFEARTGCPVLINTSFNVKGEPIVLSPWDAYRCFMRTEIDALAIEGFLLERSRQPAWRGVAPAVEPWREPNAARGGWVARARAAVRRVDAWLAPAARAVGVVGATVLMVLTFFAVVTPLGLLRRWTGGRPAGGTRLPPGASYWQPPDPERRGRERYEQQF